MTKRVLSLLLTLVMVLSLCVPALAADEFEAEAPAEVVEEAPAAPEAPVEPEAEEPVEEPVVEEAPVEEIAADEPEIASIEADEPYLVALGVVTKKAHYELELAMELAKPLKAKVDAGELYGISEGETANLIDDYDPAASFNAAYKEAQRNLDGIDGKEIVGDVSQNSVETATADLLKYIPEDDGGNGTTGNGVLAEYIVPQYTAAGNMDEVIGALLDQSKYGTWDKDYLKGLITGDHEAIAKVVSKEIHWVQWFRADFRDALVKAVEAAGDLGTTVAYKDYAAVVKLFKDAKALAKEAGIPNSSEATALKAAADKAYKAVTAWQNAKDENKADEEAKWVGGATTLTYLSTDQTINNVGGNTPIEYANSLLSKTTGNSFNDGVTYAQYIGAMTALTLTEQSQTLTVKAQKLEFQEDDKGVLSVTLTVKRDNAKDSNNYYYAYQIGSDWVNPTTYAKSTDRVYSSAIDWDDDGEATIVLRPIGAGTNVFATNKSVVVYFYVDGNKDSYKPASYSSYTVNLSKSVYDGPVLKSVSINYTNMQMTVTTDTAFEAEDFNSACTNDTQENPGLQFALVDSSNKTLFTVQYLSSDKYASSWTFNLTSARQAKLTAGDCTLEMRVRVPGSEGAVKQDSKTVTIRALSKNGDIMDVMEDAVDLFSGLVKSDWTLKAGVPNSTYKTYDEAWARMEANAKTCQDMIDKASTLADTVANRNTATKAADNVETVKTTYLTPVDRNWDAFLTALKAAKAVTDEGYTYKTWGALQVAIDDANVLNGLSVADNPDKTVQSKIDAMTKKLNDAVAALTKENGVDKASLKSAIDAASALKEADYTAESWKAAALADAIKAAQTVYDNKNATQAQVNAAIEALRTAQGKLVKKTPEVPTVPAGWTGFKQNDAGTWYFFKNGVMMKDYWVLDQSKHDLWYHMGSDGTLDTGFKYITDKTQNDGWFMLQTTNDNGMLGAALTGWQSTGSSAGNGYFETKHNGHYCECTWTKAWGDYNFKTGVWTDGQQHVG